MPSCRPPERMGVQSTERSPRSRMLRHALSSSRPTMSATATISPVRSTRVATVREMRNVEFAAAPRTAATRGSPSPSCRRMNPRSAPVRSRASSRASSSNASGLLCAASRCAACVRASTCENDLRCSASTSLSSLSISRKSGVAPSLPNSVRARRRAAAASDPARDLHGLAVQRLRGRGIPLPGRDLAEVAAHHGLDPRVTARMPDPRQRAVEQLPRARPVAALAVEEPEVVQVEQLFLEGLFLLAAQFFPGLERAIPLTREVVGDAEIVPGDGLLAIVAQGAVELHRARRRPGGALMVSPQPERGAQARESVGLGAAVAPPPRDEHRRAFLGDCAPRFPSVPGASAEQVVQPRRRLLIALLARERQGRLRQLLPPRIVAPHRLPARLDRGDRE